MSLPVCAAHFSTYKTVPVPRQYAPKHSCYKPISTVHCQYTHPSTVAGLRVNFRLNTKTSMGTALKNLTGVSESLYAGILTYPEG